MRPIILTLLSGFALGALASALQAHTVQGPPAPGTHSTARTAGKSCTWDSIGTEGCSVTLVMTAVAKEDEEDGDFCGQLFADCPAGQPEGDPAESCHGPLVCNLHETDGPNQVLTVTCDGQTFGARPKTGKTWGSAFKDCGDLVIDAK
jgi:hypothetical protein